MFGILGINLMKKKLGYCDVKNPYGINLEKVNLIFLYNL